MGTPLRPDEGSTLWVRPSDHTRGSLCAWTLRSRLGRDEERQVRIILTMDLGKGPLPKFHRPNHLHLPTLCAMWFPSHLFMESPQCDNCKEGECPWMDVG